MKMNWLGFVFVSLLGALEGKTWGPRSSTTTTISSSSTSTSSSTMSTSTTSSSTTSTSSTYTTSSLTYSSFSSATVMPALPTQSYFINIERPRMVNQINIQRSGMRHPLLCQDSLLTSLAQQHANDMAAIDTLDHDLPCSSSAFPVQFCSSKTRLSPYGQAAENIASLTGNNGSASLAMSQFNSDAAQFSNMMNPEYLYIGVGMAMNPISGKYYWVQVFSNGNYQGVSCTYEPSVTVLDAYNRTTTTVQPAHKLNLSVYPKGITNNNDKHGLFCTLIPFAHGSGSSALPLGQLPYPTITMVPFNQTEALNSKITGIIGAFAAALSKANATIVGPSSMKYVPMQIQPTDMSNYCSYPLTSSPKTSLTITSTTTSADAASLLASFTPSNSSQSSMKAAMSSMLADPSMSAAAGKMAQFMMMATPSSTTIITSTSKSTTTSSSSTSLSSSK